MNGKRDPSAILYLENAVVQQVAQSKFGWMVKATITRETREGESRRWFTLWFKEQPNVEKADVINASGYISVKGREVDGKIRFDIELQSSRLNSVTPGVEEGADPWSGAPGTGWAE
jgi:hypothetical protein